MLCCMLTVTFRQKFFTVLLQQQYNSNFKYIFAVPSLQQDMHRHNRPSPVPVVELYAVHEYVTIIPVWQGRCFSTSVNICAAQTRSIVDVNITFLSLLFLQRIREYKKRDRRARIGFIWLGMGIPGEMF